MDTNELLLEPVKYYQHGLKDLHKANTEELLQQLVNTSGVDTEENKVIVTKYKKVATELANEQKALRKTKGWMTFQLVFGIICLVGILFVIIAILRTKMYWLIAIAAFLLFSGIFLLVLRSRIKRNGAVKIQQKVDELTKKCNEIKAEAEASLAPLYALFNSDIATNLFSKTLPCVKFDKFLSSETALRLAEQFDEKIDKNVNASTVALQSGTLANNPFIERTCHTTYMGSQVYTGTLTVTYTVTVRDSNGSHSESRTEILTATITKPKPKYNIKTELDFYTTAAPNLCFDRSPSELWKKNEKQVEKYIKDFEKDDNKKAQKAIKKGQTYTKLANSTFEAYFNSENRNNEVEYRLMFTPLAQKNIEYMFSQKEPYGDDVIYIKDKKINRIISTHSQSFDYSGGSYNYCSFDYEELAKSFIQYNMDFFTGMYFDFATILSIPLFHQHETEKYITTNKPARNFSAYEEECLLNYANYDLFKHEDTGTEVILKTTLLSKDKESDTVVVHALSYQEIPSVEMVPRTAGNGRVYMVPVHYFIYEPLEKDTAVRIYNIKEGQPSKSGINYRNLDFEILNIQLKEKNKNAK